MLRQAHVLTRCSQMLDDKIQFIFRNKLLLLMDRGKMRTIRIRAKQAI
jgi:hypothetical protein